MIFSNNVHDSNQLLNLHINGHKLSKVSSCKYLGMVFDEHLKFDLHVDYVYRKLLKFTGIFYKLRNILPIRALRHLQYAFIHPHVIYGIEIYGNACQAVLDKLYKLNNKLLRILLNKNKHTPVINLYASYNTLPISKLFDLQLLICLHKYVYLTNLLPLIFHSYFSLNSNTHNHLTRRNSVLVIYRSRSAIGQKCTEDLACKLWNSVPLSLKTIASPTMFKHKCKAYLLALSQYCHCYFKTMLLLQP